MDGLGLLIGHLIGDYIVQNDWMASNKSNAWPYPVEGNSPLTPMLPSQCEARMKWKIGHLACLVHCVLYTISVWFCSFWWMPWWGLVVCFAVHFPIDRWRLAGVWMRNVSGQLAFATGPLSPWSIIVVDNTFHLLTLFVIAAIAGKIAA